MMIKSLRQLLKAYWKEQTKVQLQQKKSQLLIYDEHLKRFVSADELLVPSGNRVGGPICKRKSKDLLYEQLLKKFVNTKLDIFNPGVINNNKLYNIYGSKQKHENIFTSSKDFFWGKKKASNKHNQPALPPASENPENKEQEITKTGWAGQRTADPKTDPRPELSTSSDCPLGPSKSPEKKKPPKKKNLGQKLVVCSAEKHKILAKEEPNHASDQTKQSKTRISTLDNKVLKSNELEPHSKAVKSEVKNKDVMHNKGRSLTHIIKSKSIRNEQHQSHSCTHTSPATVEVPCVSNELKLPKIKPKEQLDCNKTNFNDDIHTLTRTTTKTKDINNRIKNPLNELKRETPCKTQDNADTTNNRDHIKCGSIKIDQSSKRDKTLKCSDNKNMNEKNKICPKGSKTEINQYKEVNTICNQSKLCKPTSAKNVPNVVNKDCSAKLNFNFTVNPKRKQNQTGFKISKCSQQVACDVITHEYEGSGVGKKEDSCLPTTLVKCSSVPVIIEPDKCTPPRLPDLSNDYCNCKEDNRFSKAASKKGLEFGLKRFQESNNEKSRVNLIEDNNVKCNTTEKKSVKCFTDDENLSPQPCPNINKTKPCGMDSKATEKLETITQSNCLNEIGHNNDFSKLKCERYVGFQIKKSYSDYQETNNCGNRKSDTKLKESQHEEKCKTNLSGNKVKKSINNKSTESKKLNKVCNKISKASKSKNCSNKDVEKSNNPKETCKLEENNGSQNDKCKTNPSQDKHLIKKNKNKLQIINELSSNMSSRHSKEIGKKCNQVINVKSSTKESKNLAKNALLVRTPKRKVLCESTELYNETGSLRKESNTRVKIGEISLKSRSLEGLKTKNINEIKTKHINKPVSKCQSIHNLIKQKTNIISANICNKTKPSNSKNSNVLNNPIENKIDDKNTLNRCKTYSKLDKPSIGRLKSISRKLCKRKSFTKCVICNNKPTSNHSLKSIKKHKHKPNISENGKALDKQCPMALRSQSVPKRQKERRQRVRCFSGLSFQHNSEYEKVNVKSKTQFKKFTSENSTYNSNTLSKPIIKKEFRSFLNDSNMPKKKQGCQGDFESNSQRSLTFTSPSTNKLKNLNGKSIKRSVQIIKIKGPNIVRIQTNLGLQNLPHNFEIKMLNSSSEQLNRDSSSANTRVLSAKPMVRGNKSSSTLANINTARIATKTPKDKNNSYTETLSDDEGYKQKNGLVKNKVNKTDHKKIPDHIGVRVRRTPDKLNTLNNDPMDKTAVTDKRLKKISRKNPLIRKRIIKIVNSTNGINTCFDEQFPANIGTNKNYSARTTPENMLQNNCSNNNSTKNHLKTVSHKLEDELKDTTSRDSNTKRSTNKTVNIPLMKIKNKPAVQAKHIGHEELTKTVHNSKTYTILSRKST